MLVSPLTPLIEVTVSGLGYELVGLEFSGRGLLRVFIDHPYQAGMPAQQIRAINIDDCERVSNQLSHVLAVENIQYQRLEVSSPGLDRALHRVKDYVRFMGHEVSVKLRQVFNGRKQYRGVIQDVVPADDQGLDAQVGLLFEDQAGNPQRLTFTLAEVDQARLVPQLDFRSNKK